MSTLSRLLFLMLDRLVLVSSFPIVCLQLASKLFESTVYMCCLQKHKKIIIFTYFYFYETRQEIVTDIFGKKDEIKFHPLISRHAVH